MHNPKVSVTVITDDSTASTFTGWRSCIKEMINHLQVIPIPKEYNQIQRSRYLKPNLRKFIKGDYLFIDTDTIICDSLEEIDNTDADIALVADCNGNLLLDEQSVINRCHIAGFNNMNNQPYFNSGVIYCKDSSCTHRLFNEWHNAYCNNIANGVSQDQPTLALADRRCGYIIHELDGIWNCQVKRNGLRYLNRAKIIHYFGSESKAYTAQIEYLFCSDELYWKVAEEGYITPEIKSMVSAAKSAFPEQVQLCAGEFLATQVFKRFRYLFYQHRKLFNVLNNLVSGMFSCARVFAKNRVKQL